MSSTQQSGNGQNQQRQGGTTGQQQQSHHNQPTRNGGEQLWNAMNAGVGNPSAVPIDPRLVTQAVGQIPGVVPTATRNQVQQTAQGTGGQSGQPVVSQPSGPVQGNNTGRYSSQPQGMNVVQPQQPVFNVQGYQQYTPNPHMTPNAQQGQTGNANQQAGQPMGPGGTAANAAIPVPSPYPSLPSYHGIAGRRAQPRPGDQQTWRVDGPR